MTLSRVEVVGGGPAGLFAARLIRERFPGTHVRVSERSVPDDTFGFGVAFTERTLRAVADVAPDTCQAMVAASVPMPHQEIRVNGVSARSKGQAGGLAIARSRLLSLLLDAALEKGVEVELGRERSWEEVRDADLVIGADGAGSTVRTELAPHLDATVAPGRGLFMWLGCSARLPSNLFAPAFTEHGMVNIHGYPYAEDRSTIGVETDVDTWRRAGLEAATLSCPADESDEYSIDYLQNAFHSVLGGAKLLGNRSRWMRFRTVNVKRWHHENVVLIGDAAHTAHYSVGSGTKMAMEDAIALVAALAEPDAGPLETALDRYEATRRPRVEALQETAVRSQQWWESLRQRVDLAPARLMLAYLSRAGVVSAARLAGHDPDLLRAGLEAFSGAPVEDAALERPTDWVLAQPHRVAAFASPTRVLGGGSTAALPRYERVTGTPGTVTAARRRLPDAVLIATLSAPTGDAFGVAGDALVEQCEELLKAGADGIWFAAGDSRRVLLDALAAGERIRSETTLFTVAEAAPGFADDLADGVLAGRTDFVAFTTERD
ncbi:FAD-dependent monooxygenase [Amycolatopsis rhabdoformis]|uniref:FAD-dependent monooxygenase n=1 Tax=Amycolatopsis rhabdoformis TaxID=1448059 RepID=A0ABZ1IKL7_9PSEU|nr:FAD-dependent monooxygenase [Amycolatopsis rhabdoformis]WSE34730.1 FAD-dependent monooxygenase [Amycolatopsis rhabdoformis]